MCACILTICAKITIENTMELCIKTICQTGLAQNDFEKGAHHPEEGLVSEALVLLDCGENAEHEAHEDRHKPGKKV